MTPGTSEYAWTVLGLGFWSPGCPSVASLSDALLDAPLDGRSSPEASYLAPRQHGRATPITRMVAEVLRQLHDGASPDCAMVCGSKFGEIGRTIELLSAIRRGDATLSPLRFQTSVHNTAVGALSIATRNQHPNTAICAGNNTAAMTLLEAQSIARESDVPVAAIVAEEGLDGSLSPALNYPSFAAGVLLAPARTAWHEAADHAEGPPWVQLGPLERLPAGDTSPALPLRLRANPVSAFARIVLACDRIARGSEAELRVAWSDATPTWSTAIRSTRGGVSHP